MASEKTALHEKFHDAFVWASALVDDERRRGEETTVALAAEDTSFVRLNHARVRQAGQVAQSELSLTVAVGTRSTTVTTGLSGDTARDRDALLHAFARAREAVAVVPDDPHAVRSSDTGDVVIVDTVDATSGAVLTDALLQAAEGLDLVGIVASGPVVRAVKTSEGFRGFASRNSFVLDWSVFATRDRAIKQGLSGRVLDEAALRSRIDEARNTLPVLSLEPREIPKGKMRAYLAPEAVLELFELLAWGGFGARSYQTTTSPLSQLERGVRSLHPDVRIREDVAEGVAPPFSQSGFSRQKSVSLVDAGKYAGALTSPRSAREYGVPTTGHDNDESPVALVMDGGDITSPLTTLGDGVYLSNLWYLNWSDRKAARVTGMTRYACMVVENGEMVAPLSPMRFDDSIFRVLGEALIGRSREVPLLVSSGTYERRSVSAARVPGVLLSGLEFTL